MRTYDVHLTKSNGIEITIRKRGIHEGDALDRAVATYPRCRLAWVWLSHGAKIMHFGLGGIAAHRDGGLL